MTPLTLARRHPLICTVALAWIFGNSLDKLPTLEPRTYLLGAPVLVGALVVFRRGPHWCLAAYLALTIWGLYRTSIPFGPIDVRVPDAALLALALWVPTLRRQLTRPFDVGQRYLGMFMFVMGFSLLPAIIRGEGSLVPLGVSWSRLVVTLAVAWLAPYALATTAQRRFVLQVALGAMAVEVARALFQTATTTGFGNEVRAGLEGRPNQTGLFAALLVIGAVHAPEPVQRPLRIAMGALGVGGVLATRSVGSIATLGLTLGLLGIVPRFSRQPAVRRSGTAPLRLALLVVGTVAIAQFVRPVNVPGSSDDFDKSTTAHRLVVAYSGLQLFVDNPLLGVGWQRSSLPTTLGNEEISEKVRRKFPNVNREFYPDVRMASVHNFYIQVLCEAGLLGAVALLVLFAAGATRIRRLLANLPTGPDSQMAWTVSLMLLALLIWWNENPVYGAEPETMLTAMFLGFLASYGMSALPSPAARTAPAIIRAESH